MYFFKKNKYKFNQGMTYVELIVVLSIFALVSGTILFNYKSFQEKVDLKNLSNEVALKIIEMQKLALSGKLPSISQYPEMEPNLWKPSYGIYFRYDMQPDGKVFYTYVDRDQNGLWDEVESENCPVNECLAKHVITKGNFYGGDAPLYVYKLSGEEIKLETNESLDINFVRPDSRAVIRVNGQILSDIDYAKIVLNTPGGLKSEVKVYVSGRVQID